MFELFYTRKEYNIMNQLYVNKKIKKKKQPYLNGVSVSVNLLNMSPLWAFSGS